jgi:uncharacterized protein YjbI with pentapeptide repeats
LLRSFGYNKGVDSHKILNNAIRDLEDNASKSVDEESIVFFSVDDDNVEEKYKAKNLWRQVDISSNDYVNLWLHRWISLYILKRLNPDKELDKDKLTNIIRFSSGLVEGHLKIKNLCNADLSHADLSKTRLSHVNLYDANLSKANLTEAKLPYANLSYANLSGGTLIEAVLSYADLSSATIHNTNLSHADLSFATLRNAKILNAVLPDANLSYANLSNCNLSHADLSNADLSHAILSNCNLSHADLFHADLSHADLSWADLSHADLSWADLSHANLSGVDASLSLLINIESFGNLKLDQHTKIDNLLTDMHEFIEYIKAQNYKQDGHLKLVENRQQLMEELKIRQYSDNFIKLAVEKSKLKS